MAAERYLSRRIPDLRVGNNIDEIDKKLIPASIHPCYFQANSVKDTGTLPTTCLHVKYHLKRIWACPVIYNIECA